MSPSAGRSRKSELPTYEQPFASSGRAASGGRRGRQTNVPATQPFRGRGGAPFGLGWGPGAREIRRIIRKEAFSWYLTAALYADSSARRAAGSVAAKRAVSQSASRWGFGTRASPPKPSCSRCSRRRRPGPTRGRRLPEPPFRLEPSRGDRGLGRNAKCPVEDALGRRPGADGDRVLAGLAVVLIGLAVHRLVLGLRLHS
jgi:hypothetical protein